MAPAVHPRLRAVFFLLLGGIGCVAALMNPNLTLPGLLVGVFGFFTAGTLLGSAYQIARSLSPMLGQSIAVEIWGTPLAQPGHGALPDAAFRVDSIAALGAGLLIHLRASQEGPRILLKVAQPRGAKPGEQSVEIADAAYVSWAGVRLPRAAGKPALILRLASQAPLELPAEPPVPFGLPTPQR